MATKKSTSSTPFNDTAFFLLSIVSIILIGACIWLSLRDNGPSVVGPIFTSTAFGCLYLLLAFMILWLGKNYTDHVFHKTLEKDADIRRSMETAAFFGTFILLISAFLIGIYIHKAIFPVAVKGAECFLLILFIFLLVETCYIIVAGIVEYFRGTSVKRSTTPRRRTAAGYWPFVILALLFLFGGFVALNWDLVKDMQPVIKQPIVDTTPTPKKDVPTTPATADSYRRMCGNQEVTMEKGADGHYHQQR